jgi:hypothetical protein
MDGWPFQSKLIARGAQAANVHIYTRIHTRLPRIDTYDMMRIGWIAANQMLSLSCPSLLPNRLW